MMSNTPYIGGSWKRHRVAIVDAVVGMQLKMHLDGFYVDTTNFEADPETVDVWVANHTSRYDGFLIWKTKHELVPAGRLFTMMLSESLKRHSVFDGAGAVGLTPGSHSSIRSIIRFIENVPEAGDGLVIFPQGKIFPGDKEPPEFRSITRLGTRTGPPARFVPCGIAVEMLDRRKPSAFLRLGHPIVADDHTSASRAERAVTDVVRSLRRDLSEHGESLPDAWSTVRSASGRGTYIH